MQVINVCSLSESQDNLCLLYASHWMEAQKSARSDKPWWFYCEYDSKKVYGRLPKIFCRDLFHEIPDRVRLYDRVSNEFEVSIYKTKGHVYFSDGWHNIGKLYNLQYGGWLKVEYPKPARTFKLNDVEDNKSFVSDEEHFYHSLVKTLPDNQARDSLLLPAGFCYYALSKERTTCVLRDERKKSWHCGLTWSRETPNECCITDGWLEFADANGLKPGNMIKMSVAKNSRCIIYVKHFTF